MATAPPNFSWCEPNLLAGCAFPEKLENIQYLVDNNVSCIVSLTSERDVNKGEISDSVLKIVKVPIQDYTPPTMDQVEQFLQCVREAKEKGTAVTVHCAHGCGRTGTMLGCYYTQAMTPDAAIKHVRQLRPGSIETPEQELLVHQFSDFLISKGKKSKISPSIPPNFSWCEKTLAGCAFPEKIENIQYLVDHNVACIVSLTSERDVDKGNFSDDVLKIVKVPIQDYTPPSMEQVEQFLQCVRDYSAKDKAVTVHCAHGCGRTGTMLSCYYTQNMAPEKAIEYVRQLRPGSVETSEQEMLVKQFSDYLAKKKKM